MFDTIVAISTGKINQPISIIKISGPNSFAIAKKIFSGKVGQNKNITYGNIIENNEIIDEVLISWFKSPNTFTGEDIVEINAHGGIVNTHRILKIILKNGARIALKGEFTRRAFFNKKINLIKAEAIHDLIFAKTKEQAKISVKKFDGQTTDLINKIVHKLLLIIGIIETNIDYPEYDDIEILNKEKIIPKLNNVLNDLKNIKKTSVSSIYIFKGVNVCIVGRPNAGKSSLLNAIIGENKAIVTSEPGTTRDVVEASVQINQIMFNLNDTAGIRNPNHKIEEIGIQKTFEQIEKSNLVLHVVDSSQKENDYDKLIQSKSQEKIYIKIYNKIDLVKNFSTKDSIVSCSTINGDILNVINAIKSHFKNINLNDEKIITNTRQLSLIDKSIINIETAIFEIQNNNLEPDEIIVDIRDSWKNISNIIGKYSNEDMLDAMFKNFCLGK